MKPNNILLILATLLLALALSVVALAEPPAPSTADVTLAGTVASKISYQGRLTDASGNPLTGTYNLVFQLWDAVTGGNQVGGDIVKNNVSVNNGLFTVYLDVPQSAFNGQALWLRIQVGGQWLSPRQELLPVPYALSLRPGAQVEGDSSEKAFSVTNTGSGDVRNYGGYFVAAGTQGRGVYGKASNTADAMNYGGFFYSSGVQGRGVFGQAEGSSGIGVKGWASNAGDVQNYGGHFTATGSRGIGVYGWAENEGDVENYGGYFLAAGQRGTGIYGEGSTFGVHGESNNWAVYGNGYIGVAGMGLKPRDGRSYGGYFDALGNQGVGVAGIARSGGDAENYGGYFSAAGQQGIGVYGYASGDNGIGVYGRGGASGYAGYFEGDVEVRGDLTVSGSFFPRPIYNSGWVDVAPGEERILAHNLGGNTDNYIVDVQFRHDGFIHNLGYGGDDKGYANEYAYIGAYYWFDATNIGVVRLPQDDQISQIRIRIWVYK
jgi:hypothetical protein